MTRRIAVYGGSFNPPGRHHRRLVEGVAASFDEVVVVPCGPRPDKGTTNEVEAIHRATMVDLTLADIPGVEVDLFDLEADCFTRSCDLVDRYAERGEVWLVIGTDLIAGGASGASEIVRYWARGEQLWNEGRFAIVTRKDIEFDERDLPPTCELIALDLEGSSSSIRERAFHRQDVSDAVVPEVATLIDRYGLYRGSPASRVTRYCWDRPHCLVVCDENNDAARAIAARFPPLAEGEKPELIVVIGGDGTMLQAIRTHWRKRLPFLGWNAGHRGFLLNEIPEPVDASSLEEEFVLYHLPLLYVEVVHPDGSTIDSLAFNDAWVERRDGQAGWIEVSVDGRVRLPRLVADGALVATSPGSTAYARAMGATPLLVNASVLLLVGSNPLEPPNWRSAHLPLDSRVELRNLDMKKRPLRAFIDGIPHGEVSSLRVRLSRIAAVELAFAPGRDMAEKLARIQFPTT